MESQNNSKSSFKKIKKFFMDWPYLLEFVLGFVWGPIIIALALAALRYAFLPSWIVSLIIVAGWCKFNYDCWRYEAWRASGPRGIFVNTCGASGYLCYDLIWLFFGFFIMLFNILLRIERVQDFCENIYNKLHKQ